VGNHDERERKRKEEAADATVADGCVCVGDGGGMRSLGEGLTGWWFGFFRGRSTRCRWSSKDLNLNSISFESVSCHACQAMRQG
jgi:hypothetical protein